MGTALTPDRHFFFLRHLVLKVGHQTHVLSSELDSWVQNHHCPELFGLICGRFVPQIETILEDTCNGNMNLSGHFATEIAFNEVSFLINTHRR